MNVRRFALVAFALSLFAAGCSAEAADGSDTVTLTGKVGSGSTAARDFGGVSIGSGGVHVAARKLHKEGEPGGKVEVLVGPDGSFRLEVARGSRYVVTIDDDQDHSAILEIDDGKNVLSVSTGEDGATVDLGNVTVQGGEAYAEVKIDGKLGLQATLAEADEIFEAANGAILAAREAIAQAEKAAEEARQAAEQARDAAEQARDAAEKAAAEAAKVGG